MRRMALIGAVVALGALLGLSGCKGTGEGFKPAQKRSEAPERDCRKIADRVCEVPQKDGKVVLMCFKGPWAHSVRNRWDC